MSILTDKKPKAKGSQFKRGYDPRRNLRGTPKRAMVPSSNGREYDLWSRYGITQEEYNDLLVQQGGVCAICGEPETSQQRHNGRYKQKPLAVDHDHLTGRVRGLLCVKCNLIIGKFDKDPSYLHKIVNYFKFGMKYGKK